MLISLGCLTTDVSGQIQNDSLIIKKSFPNPAKLIGIKDTIYSRDSILNKAVHPKLKIISHLSNQIDTSMRSDSIKLKNSIDSVGLKKGKYKVNLDQMKIGASISLRNSTYYSKAPFIGQELPLIYNRTYLDIGVNAGIIPLNFSFQYATDGQFTVQRPGMFRIGIDYEKFQSLCKTRLNKIESNSQYSKELDSIENLIKNSTELLEKLKNKNLNYNYKNEISNYKKMLEEASKDSLNLWSKKSRFKIAKEKVDKHNLDAKIIDSLEVLRKTWIQRFRFVKALKETDLNSMDLGNYKATKIPFDKHKLYSFLGGIKDIGFGDVYADYSELLTNGISLRGGKIDYEAKNWYTGITTGSTVKNTSNRFIPNTEIKEMVTCTQFGIGNIQQNYLGIVLVNGKVQSPSIKEVPLNTKPFSMAIKGGVRYEDIIFMEFERAASTTIMNNSVIQSDQVLQTIFKGGLNTASKAKVGGDLLDKRLKLSAGLQQVGLYFNSSSNPYLRNDFMRIEFKADHLFLNRKLRISEGLRRDKDNLSGIKKYSTIINSYELGVEWRRKSHLFKIHYLGNTMDFLHVDLQPIKTKLITTNYSNIKSFTNGTRMMTNLLYQYVHTSQANDTLKTSNHNFNINSFIQFRLGSDLNFTFNRLESYSKDTSNQTLISVIYGYPFKRFRFQLGTQYRDLNKVEIRYVLVTGIIYKRNKFSSNLGVENSIIERASATKTNINRSLIAKLDLILKF